MAAKTKTCPQCGTMMDFRLGTFECPQCGHTEEGEKPPEAKGAASTGPGFRKEAWHRSATPTTGQPGQVPPPQSAGTIYTPGAAPPPGLYGGYESTATASKYPTLETEKKIVFGIQAGCSAIEIILILIAGIAAEAGGAAALNFIGNLIGFGIGIWILWYVLFEAQLWMKRACCAWQGCSLIGVIILMLMATTPSALNMLQVNPLDHNLYVIGIWLVLLPQMLWIGWIMFILWRDIQEATGR